MRINHQSKQTYSKSSSNKRLHTKNVPSIWILQVIKKKDTRLFFFELAIGMNKREKPFLHSYHTRSSLTQKPREDTPKSLKLQYTIHDENTFKSSMKNLK